MSTRETEAVADGPETSPMGTAPPESGAHELAFLRRESQRSAVAAALAELAERSALGIVVVKDDRALVAVNETARHLFREGVLHDDGGRLASTATTAALDAALGRMLTEGKRGPVFLGLDRPDGGRPYPVAVQRSGRGLVTLYVGDVDAPVPTVVRRLEAQYALTYAEARVAARLASGLSVPEVAFELGVQESTVRTHLKHAFQKTGVNRQAELVRLVLALPLR